MFEPGIYRRGLIIFLILMAIALGTFGCHAFLVTQHIPGYDSYFLALILFLFVIVAGVVAFFVLYILYRVVLGPIAWLLYGDIDMPPNIFWAKVRGKA
jgi:hypothetical protein